MFVLVAVTIGIPSQCFCKQYDQKTEKLPLWEYGVVGMVARLPHYPGSNTYSNYVLPLPYLVYRGDIIRANQEGLRGIFWHNDKFETDISFSGNPPVSNDDTEREGMPELDSIVEMGPALRYYFYKDNEENSFFLQTDLRLAVSVGFDSGIDTRREGYTSEFSLVYKNARALARSNSSFNLSIGLKFSDSALNSYFYEVSPEYQRADRLAYKAHGGYSGAQFAGSFVKRLNPKVSLRLYGKFINISEAIFEDSPLVQTQNNYVIACMLTYKLGESKRLEN